MQKVSGIYKITSPSGSIYVGQSEDIYKRTMKYKSLNCKKQQKLYNSLKKYGFINHQFEIIKECSKSELNKWETHYVDFFDCYNTDWGLNLKPGGGNNVKMSELETKQKISNAKKGINFNPPISEETRKKLSARRKGNKNHFFGKKHSEETKNKLREANIGKKKSQETKDKISQAITGQKRTPEQIERILLGRINGGRMNHSAETKQKLREINLGKKHSTETKKKISAIVIAHLKNKRQLNEATA